MNGLTRAVALGTVFVLPTAVDAGVLYSGVQNLTATLAPADRLASLNTQDGTKSAGIDVDVDGDLVNDFAFDVRQGRSAGGGRRYGLINARGLVLGNAVAAGEGQFPIRVTSSSINAVLKDWDDNKQLLYRRGSGSRSGFGAGSPFILGVRFDRGGNTHYGWIRLLLGEGSGGFGISVTGVDWAWNDTAGAGIHISPVPEANPALALLAAGGTALAGWRLSRRAKVEGGVASTPPQA